MYPKLRTASAHPGAGRAASIVGPLDARSARRGVGAELDHRATQEARHVHLRAADSLADLPLGELVDQAQSEHLAFDVAQPGPARRDRLAMFSELEPDVLAAQRLGERGWVLRVAGDRGIE